jgi:hypothetical protein
MRVVLRRMNPTPNRLGGGALTLTTYCGGATDVSKHPCRKDRQVLQFSHDDASASASAGFSATSTTRRFSTAATSGSIPATTGWVSATTDA